MPDRFKNLQATLAAKKLEAFIITNAVNIFYLIGFRGVSPTEREAILIVTSNTATLITARLYQQEAKKLASANLKIKIAAERNEINQFIKEALRGSTPKTVGFEEHDLKFSEFKEFKKILNQASQYSSSGRREVSLRTNISSSGKFSPPFGGSNINRPIKHKLIPTKNLVENLRVIKTADEIKNIERAQLISQRAFDQIIKTIKVGQTEAEIAETLSQIIKGLGGQGLAFDPIVASGPNSALPHYVTGDRRLTMNDILLFDFGAKYKDYCADLSRTIFITKAPDEKRNIYHHVQTSQNMAIAKIRAQISTAHVYKSATKHFKKHNLHDYFLHSLGHGIGLQVHEKPSLSAKSKDTLGEGMVFSVEPGLYFPKWGGVRIEDLVVIEGGKAKLLGQGTQFIEIKA